MLQGLLTPEDDIVRDVLDSLFRAGRQDSEAEASAALGRPAHQGRRKMLAEVIDFRLMNEFRGRVDTIVKDPETAATLKAILPLAMPNGRAFMTTFSRASTLPNVHLVDTSGCGIERFRTPTAMVVRDKAYDVDCVIFATGFEARYLATTRLTGSSFVAAEASRSASIGRKASEPSMVS